MKDSKLEMLKKYINEAKNIVFFGGAGVSTESGLKDFRSSDGLFFEKSKFSPEKILSHSFFKSNPQEFYRFYREKLNSLTIQPNITHYKLTELENLGKLKAIITQNIDDLHTKAGSKNVLELHGSIKRNYCLNCNKAYDANYVFKSSDIPKCSCGGIIKPDVVLYEEALDADVLTKAIESINSADLLIVAGTSLTVYPASNLISFFKGKHLVLINRDLTSYDGMADLVIHENLSKIFKYL